MRRGGLAVRGVLLRWLPLIAGISVALPGTLLWRDTRVERKRAERALQKSRDFYLTLFDGFPTPIWRAGKDRKCDYFNKTWLEFTGRRLEEELGDGWTADVHPVDLDRVLAEYLHSFDRREPFEMEYRLRHHSGAFRWILDVGRPFRDLDGEFEGYIGACYDVTERRNAAEEIRRLNAGLEAKVEERTRQLLEAQEELVRKEKLAILGQLSGSVSHELRNPLVVISNAVYFLKEILGAVDQTVTEYLGIIEQEIENSLRIITDHLDFARTNPPQKTPVAVRGLVLQSLARCALPDRLAAALDVPEELPKLMADPLQISQVLTNLITNAVQAMPDGGELRIGAARVPGSRPGNGEQVAIRVTDTGQGISPENMKKLFQPLFTTKVNGIGLGLVVCKNLAEANGGSISVESEPGVGTTFTVTLPCYTIFPLPAADV
jgi:PAS domain S-box-containing protein